MAVIGEMQHYQNMPYPPKETLMLLDSRTSSRLISEWPHLSGPIRQSIVQTLPTVARHKRTETLDEMLHAAETVNDMLGESMKMLNQALQQIPSQEKRSTEDPP